MTNLDWTFVPAWLLFDINESKQKIKTKMIGVYHIGPKDQINIKGETVLMLKEQGKIIIITHE